MYGNGNLKAMAESALSRGLYNEAERVFNQAIAAYGNSSEEPEVADCLRGLARVYLAQGRMPEAEKAANRALAIDEDYWGGGCLQVGEAYFLMAEASRYRGELGRSEFYYIESLGHREAHLGTKHIDVAQVRGRLALLGLIHGLYPDLEELVLSAYKVWEVAPSTDEFIEFLDIKQMLRYFLEQNRRLDADKLYRSSSQFLEYMFGRSHRELLALRQFWGVKSSPFTGSAAPAMLEWQNRVTASGADSNFAEKVRLHIANLEYDKAESVLLLQLRLARQRAFAHDGKSAEVRGVLAEYAALLRLWERSADADKITRLVEKEF